MVLEGKKNTITPYHRNHPDFPLRRFVRCAVCNSPLTASWAKDKTRRWGYYWCPNSKNKCKVSVRKEDLENRFVDYLKLLTPKQEYIDLFKTIVLERWREAQADAVKASKKLEQRLQELKNPKGKAD